MKLWDEAVRISLFGTDLYAFGLYCAIGALAAALALGVLCRGTERRKGSGTLTFLFCAVFGLLGSRLAYCLLNRSLGMFMPLAAWLRITEGGWSLAGMIGGAMLGGWLAARALRENVARWFDFVCCSLPLAIAAEKFAESRIVDFDISRPLPEGFPVGNWLTVQDAKYSGVHYLATHRIGMILALCLFVVLAVFLTRAGRNPGQTGTLFLLLCGAGGVLLESLRYDHFLEFSFVRLEQVAYALLLSWGVIRCIRGDGGLHPRRGRLAAIFLLAAVLGCIAVEFALDRTGISHLLLYALMIALLAAPVILGIRLLPGKGTKNA